MKRITWIIVLIILFSCKNMEKADIIFTNGNVFTLDPNQPRVEAVAVKNGRVLQVGDSKDVMKRSGHGTEVVDLEGNFMTPGFIDGHGHFMGMGYSLMELNLLHTDNYVEVIDQVKKAVENTPPGEWITGRGWHQDKWDTVAGKEVDGFPTHHLLSKVSESHPVVLVHASGHALLANQKAMNLAAITSQTGSPEGGEIIKDENGMPTGLFNETAMGLINRHIPERNEQSDLIAYRLATENCLKEGITGFHDAGIGQEYIDWFKRMVKEDKARIRIYAMLDGSDESLLDRFYNTGPYIDSVSNLLTIRSVKLFADGALGSRGAWLADAYSDMPDHFGHSVTGPDYIRHVSVKSTQNGFQTATHAIGDRANHEVLDIYEEILKENPNEENPRFRIEHAQHLLEEDIPRFDELGVIPSMQAIHMSSDRPWAIERLGKERIEAGAYVWQKLLGSGARIVNGTDVPVEPLSPIQCFYAAVTRKTLEGYPPGGFEPDQKMTREQAIRSYTLNPAYAAFEEKVKGSIEIGKLADFTVFSNNLLSVPEEEILNTHVVMTIINGEVLYRYHE